MSLGVTTCEAKSGYGLELETEVKMLEVVKKLNETHPMDVVSTFMPAHAVEEQWKGREEEYIQLCCSEMMPYVKEHQLAEFCGNFQKILLRRHNMNLLSFLFFFLNLCIYRQQNLICTSKVL